VPFLFFKITFMNKRFFLNTLCWLLFPISALATTNENWFVCKETRECVLVQGQCGFALAINRDFVTAFEAQGKAESCLKTVDFKIEKKLKIGKCVQGTCQVTPK
jgi:hypothetical protein